MVNLREKKERNKNGVSYEETEELKT